MSVANHGIRAIDAVVNLYTPEAVALRPSWSRDFFGNKIGVDTETLQGVPIDGLIRLLDEAGVERAFLIASKSGPAGLPTSSRIPYEMVADVVRQHPERFSALAGIDPTEGMRGVRELEHAVKELGFIGAHSYPHWFELAPDHARYYAFYAKCVELDVPIQIQVGHCLRYSEERPLKSVGRPIMLDTVACDFPELKVIGIHTGWPWTDEMISVAYKHPKVYIGIDAYPPQYLPPALVHFANSWGQDKVIFGTDWPVIDPRRALKEIAALNLRPEPLRKLLRDNARQLYKLERRES